MKPPLCCICHQDFRASEGKLIYFTEDENDIEFNKRFEEPGFVGHPSNAFWFCEVHYPEAIKLKHLTKKEALKILRELFSNH